MRRITLRAGSAASAAIISLAASRGPTPTHLGTAQYSFLSVQTRRVSNRGFDDGDRATPANPTKVGSASSSLPRGASDNATPKYLGVVEVGHKNMSQQMETKVPLFLYFMVTNHPDVAKFTEMISRQVDQINRRSRDDNLGDAYQEFGGDRGLAIKLGMIDCLKEPGLTQKFAIDPHSFPIIYFVRDKLYIDKLTGIVPESQIKEAIEAFMDYAKAETKNEVEGNTALNKMKREDNDDENAITLLQVAVDKLQKKDIFKARELYSKALDYSLRDIDIVNVRYGVKNKKLTRELWNKLKREPCYNTAPQALCGLGMCAMASRNNEEASRIVARVRVEFPYAVSDLQEVIDAVTRIELLTITEYDMEKDSYLSLLKYHELTEDPIAFYKNRLKLVVALVMEGSHSQAIEEALRIIRAEPKLLPKLKKAGIVDEDMVLGPLAPTPGRQVILKIFESLGNTNENVVKGRRLLQLYT